MRAALIVVMLAASGLSLVSCDETGIYGLGSKREAVAELKEPHADVKVREAHKLIWSEGVDGAELANYDAIRTGSDSSGTVRYTDHAELKLGENTMVIVVDRTQKKDHDRSVVALPSGSVESKIAPNAEKSIELEVRTPRGWLRASNRDEAGRPKPMDFKTSISEKGEMKVAARQGEITFVARAEDDTLVEKKIGANETFSLPADPEFKPADPAADNQAMTEGAFSRPPKLEQKVWNTGTANGGKSSAEPGIDLFLIREPKDRTRVTDAILTVRGELSGRLRAYLMETEIRPSPQGHFELQIRLEKGANTLEFRITGPGPGDVQTETLTVIRQ